MKKILSLVLAMLMIFSMVPAVFAAETSESDYQAAIEYLKAIELYKGTTDGDAADELVERYQMALFTARMVTGRVDKAYWETDANDSDFTDIDELNAEALGGVCYAAQQGIVNGIGGSEFAPFDNVTYRDAIVMIVRALGFNYPASGYPWSYINKARELGVLDGITGISYTAEVKREVIAQLLYNAINAEIKGETIAATVFGVEETIVMVTATPDGIVYKADGAASVKANMVRVSAVDAAGEPIGAEYYVPFKELGLKNGAAANAAVGAYFKLTHKGNFSNFLACESLTQVFENTTDKKEVKYSNKILTLGNDSYLVLPVGTGYSNLTNNQGTLSGNKEIKAFKAWGANNEATVGATGYYLGTDGKVYSFANPFVPYAIYSDIADTWFQVTVNDHGAYNYTAMNDDQVAAMLATVGGKVKGFSEIGQDASLNTRMASNYGVDYDYYKAFATDTNGDGNFDRVTVRAYRLYLFQKGTRTGVQDGKSATIDTFTLTQFTGNGLTAVNGTEESPEIVGTWDSEYSEDTKYDSYTRFTGLAYSKLPAEGIIVAYLNTGVGSEKELEVVDVAEKMSAYIRGYDQASDSIIYGSDYETMKLGYMGVAGTSIYRATQCHPDYVGTWKVNAANYIRQFWNAYVDMYVLNDSVVYIDGNDSANDYVILESYTGFSEEGLTAVAYSTKAGGKVEILINELNGWQLGGFDYALYEEMLKLQALLPGLGVQVPVLPVELNRVYAVRYVNADGAYNLINPLSVEEDKEIYVNHYGYIIGVNKDGVFAENNRVATSDKDLWFILAREEGKVFSFQGKLASIHLTGADFYKAENNQFVLVIDSADQLGALLGNAMDGAEYYLYNKAIDNAYNNANIWGTYAYGHAMQNVRTGKVDFITYDSKLAAQLNAAGKWNEGQYIGVRDGAIFATFGGVLKSVTEYGVADVAALEFLKGTYERNSFAKVAIGAVIPADVELALIPGNVDDAFVSYADLVDALTAVMYEGVYGSDFHKGNVSYQNAIRLELAHKISFISLEADGTRKAWTAAKNNAYEVKTLGTADDVVYAYVMYDFANAKATVFVDNAHPERLTSSKGDTKTDIVAGVDGAITYASNKAKGETVVTIKFNKPAVVTDVTVANKTISNKWIGTDTVSFVVPEVGFEATDAITVTGTALNVSTPVAGTTITSQLGMKISAGDAKVATDGKYNVEKNIDKDRVNFQHTGFTASGVNADMTAATDVANSPYYSAIIIDLNATKKLTAFKYSMYDADGVGRTTRNFDVLVYNGTEWKVAGSVGDIAGDARAWIYHASTVEGANGYFTCTVALDETVATDVTKVALAYRRCGAYPGLGNYSSGSFLNITELAVFEAHAPETDAPATDAPATDAPAATEPAETQPAETQPGANWPTIGDTEVME